MQMTLSKRIIGAAMAAVLCLGMAPALALAPAGTAEAAELKAAEIKVPTANATKTTAKKKAKVTNLTTAFKNDELRLDLVTYKYVKNPYYNAKTDSESSKYTTKSTTDYTGKAIKPAVKIYIKNDASTKKYTDWRVNPINRNKDAYKITGYTQLKGVTITGKETKKQLAKKTKGKDFTVKYENNTALGKAQVTIKGVNKYKGTLYQSFDVHLAEFKSLSKKTEQPVKAVASGKKALKVSWNKVKGAATYVVSASPRHDYYDDNKDEWISDGGFGGVSKTVIVKGNKRSVTIKGLDSKQNYNVTVTAYAHRDGGSYKTTSRAYDKKEWVSGRYDSNDNWVEGYYKYTKLRLTTNTHNYHAYYVTESASIQKPVKTK